MANNDYFKVSEMINYCEEMASESRKLAEKCIKSTGKGESDTSSLGGAAYFLEQARIYEYDIPRILKDIKIYQEIDKLDKPLDALELTTRTRNCLSRAGLSTLEDITNLYLFELRNVRNLGETGVIEVLEMIKKHNLGLKG